jgi:Flp pilus assembly protein protease CpaA
MNAFSEPVFWVELVMLSALLGVGFYVTYTDIKLRLVSNRYTFSLLAVGLVGQLLMRYLEVTTPSRIVAVLLIALGIAVVLTLFGFWAPGDAKLFWAAVVALPPSLCPSLDPFSLQAAPVALILNALLCYVLVLLLVPLWRRERLGGEEEHRSGGRQWLQAAWGLAGLLGLSLGFALLVLGRPLSYLEGFGALVIGYRLLERGLEIRYWPVLALPGLVALLYLGLVTGGIREYILLWGAAWVVEVVYLQVRHWYSRAFVQEFPVGLLRAGAIPRHRLAPQEELVCEAGKPLTESQVRRLRDLAGQGKLPGGQVLELEQAIPFVPFIVGAAVLTASFAGNLVPPLAALIMWLRG